jgi:hypothetical protein
MVIYRRGTRTRRRVMKITITIRIWGRKGFGGERQRIFPIAQ